MSKEHPTPWKLDINDADEPIKDANGERVFATDDGFLGPDDDTIREIVDAVNERDRLRAEVAAAGELLQMWLCEAPGEQDTVAWLKRNGFDDPFPECTEEATK